MFSKNVFLIVCTLTAGDLDLARENFGMALQDMLHKEEDISDLGETLQLEELQAELEWVFFNIFIVPYKAFRHVENVCIQGVCF